MSHVPIPSDRPVRVRIAPSPTGDPHVGTAFVALFNLAFAKKHGGRFVLRIEDTDRARSSRESEQRIFESLRWLGLDWDEGPDVGGDFGPYRQSERTAIYREHVQMLIDSGRAYPCFATAEELTEMRQRAREQRLATSYDRRYRDLDPSEARRRVEAGEAHVVRMKMPLDGETSFVDGLRGTISIRNDQIDDQILLKSDGYPTYHLANVVDDHLMEITHVIRAEEWIPSTPKHVVLYDAFGWQAPTFVHLPLLRNPDKSKISKRNSPVSLEYYLRAGILPEALVNFLGRMGWSMPSEAEMFSFDEMVEAFTFERMSTTGPIFDLDKLDWLNGLYIRELSPEELVDRLEGWMLHRDFLLRLAPLVIERIKRLEDFVPMTAYFFGDDAQLTAEDLIPKKLDRLGTRKALQSVVRAVDDVREWSEEVIEATLRAQSEEQGLKPRILFHPVRIAVTGRKATPPLFSTMEVLGKARCQVRLRHALALLK